MFKIGVKGGSEERSPNKNFFKKSSECFYMYQKHTELWVRPLLFEQETFLGLLA